MPTGHFNCNAPPGARTTGPLTESVEPQTGLLAPNYNNGARHMVPHIVLNSCAPARGSLTLA
eukprot:4951972-Pyramimonas_sp.AAC.1